MQEELSTTKKRIMEKITTNLSLQEIQQLGILLDKMMKNVEREELIDGN
jgi:hypothetical protein